MIRHFSKRSQSVTGTLSSKSAHANISLNRMFAAMQYSNKLNYHSQVNKHESYSGNESKSEVKT